MALPDDDEVDTLPQTEAADPPEESDEEDTETGEELAAIEARARRAGWIPEDEWDDARAKKEGRFKPHKFVTAKAWLDRVDGDNRMLRDRNRALDTELVATRATAEKASSEVTELRKLVDDLMKTQGQLSSRAYAKARAEVEAAMDRAVEEANPDEYKASKDKLKKLDEEHAEEVKAVPETTPARAAQGKVDPYVETWVGENPWYTSDDVARGTATAIHGKLLREHPTWTLRENLAETRRQIAERYPEHFENARRNEPPSVQRPSGDRPTRQAKTITFDQLSQEQKDTYDRQSRFYKAKGREYTKDQFLADQLLG